MPNRDGFTSQHGFMRIDGKPDTHATARMSNLGPAFADRMAEDGLAITMDARKSRESFDDEC